MPALLASPLLKLGLIAGVILALIGIGEWHGRKAVQENWDAAIAVQAVQAAEQVIKAAENTARVESEFAKQLQAQAIKTKIVTKEVKVYVEGPSTKCLLTPEFERVFDGISRLYDPTADGLPAAASATGGAALAPDAPLTDTTLLLAYEGAVVELYALWDRYAALVEWTRSSYALAKEASGIGSP